MRQISAYLLPLMLLSSSDLQASLIVLGNVTMTTNPVSGPGPEVKQSCIQQGGSTFYCDLRGYAYLDSGEQVDSGEEFRMGAEATYGGLNGHTDWASTRGDADAASNTTGSVDLLFNDKLLFGHAYQGKGYIEVLASVWATECGTHIGAGECRAADYITQVHLGSQIFDTGIGPNDLPFEFSTGLVAVDFTKLVLVGLSAHLEPVVSLGDYGFQKLNFSLQSIRLYDNNGDQLSDFLYKSQSGSRYHVEGGTYSELAGVPEPSTMALFGTALAGVVLLRRIRHARPFGLG